MYIILIIIFIFICIAAFYNGVVIRKYIVNSDTLNSEQSMRIAVIADLHNTKHDKLIDMIRDMKPNIIAMPGDIVDTKYPMKYLNVFFNEVSKLGIPVYYVTGNHEMGALGTKKIKNDIRNYGIIVLEDECINATVNGINVLIAGVDDPYEKDIDKWQYDISTKFRNVKHSNRYNILLSHRPEQWKLYEELGFDLALSGHAHGGQVRIPILLNGLYAPHQGLFPKHAGGLYKHGKLHHVVSRGLSLFINLPRIFNPPELVQIDIVPKHNTSQ